MGSPNSSTPPTPPAAPLAPDYAAAANAAIQADINNLPQLNAAALQTDQANLAQLAPLQQQNQLNSALASANTALQVQQQYGPQFNALAQQVLQQSDPTGYAARQQLANAVLQGLNQGSSLDPDFVNQLQQQIRGAQAARGNILGDAPANAENLYIGNAALGLQQQRLNNALSYVNSPTLASQYAALSGAQNGPAPFAPQPFPTTGVTVNPNDAALGTQYGLGVYNGQNSAYDAGLNYTSSLYHTNVNAPNPWLQGLGLASNTGTSLVSPLKFQ
jgi:hypothetical protein